MKLKELGRFGDFEKSWYQSDNYGLLRSQLTNLGRQGWFAVEITHHIPGFLGLMFGRKPNYIVDLARLIPTTEESKDKRIEYLRVLNDRQTNTMIEFADEIARNKRLIDKQATRIANLEARLNGSLRGTYTPPTSPAPLHIPAPKRK